MWAPFCDVYAPCNEKKGNCIMNQMEKVAKLLGVCINEKFNVVDNYGILMGEGYWIGVNGLKCGESKGNFNDTLCYLLNGSWKIVKKPWKPIKSELYFFIDINGSKRSMVWDGDYFDLVCYKVGNCFKTLEEITPDVEEEYVKWFKNDEVERPW